MLIVGGWVETAIMFLPLLKTSKEQSRYVRAPCILGDFPDIPLSQLPSLHARPSCLSRVWLIISSARHISYYFPQLIRYLVLFVFLVDQLLLVGKGLYDMYKTGKVDVRQLRKLAKIAVSR